MVIKRAKSPAEVLYLTAVDRGDRKAALVALDSPANINKDCVDGEGRTALVIAIENGNIDLVELLLEKGVRIGDALLRATDVQFVAAIEPICDHLNRQGKLKDGLNCRDSKGDLHPDITPVVLAAHHNNYDILKTLLEYGAYLQDPDMSNTHDFQTTEFTLEYSIGRINIYRALASEAYIALTSEDPINTAFELSWKLQQLSERDYEFHFQYIELADQCEQLAADLLGQVRDSREQSIVLSHDPKEWVTSRDFHEPNKVKRALRLNQKKFVAHPHCQQQLIELWYRGLPSWRKQHVMQAYMISFGLGLAFPFLCLCHIFAPGSKPALLLKTPYVRFICNVASSLAFLILLSIQAVDFHTVMQPHANLNKSETEEMDQLRGQHVLFTEALVMFFVFCHTSSEIQDIMKTGTRGIKYNFTWKLLDYMMLSLYWAWIALRIIATLELIGMQDTVNGNITKTELVYDDSQSDYVDDFYYSDYYGNNANNVPSEQDSRMVELLKRQSAMELTLERIYAKLNEAELNPDINKRDRRAVRRPKRPSSGGGSAGATDAPAEDSAIARLDSLHPILVADGIFAVAKVLSFLRVIRMTVVHLNVGPMQISLGRMTYDIVRFLAIFTLVWFAFSVGLNQLYFHYTREHAVTCGMEAAGRKCNPPYGSVSNALATLFWTLFGLSDLSSLKILHMDHWFTEMVGQMLYAAYHVLAIVVLLNILIAMMSNTYTKIEEDADMQWKYARSRLWLSYYEKRTALAPPFNVFPTWDSFRKIIRTFKRKIYGNSMERKKKKRSIIERKHKEYREVVQQLTQRYLFQRKRVGEDDDNKVGPEPWIADLKRDVSGFKYDLLQSLTDMDSRMKDIQEQIDEEKKEPTPSPGTEIEHALRNCMNDPPPKPKPPKPKRNNMPSTSPLTQGTFTKRGMIQRSLRFADGFYEGEVDYTSDEETV
uniref:Short transient receptor potential channel 4-like n=1 Tax=Saccoglossus kowalevskii TaxID=10224 RepID=A0ABM0MLU4_SACKO|nr:PREDICTED: short transient receptor potential channel 4-like [Saccoglossus kowalevskii]